MGGMMLKGTAREAAAEFFGTVVLIVFRPAAVGAPLRGAFAASAVTFATYREAFDRFDGGLRQVSGPKATAFIFATYPQEFLSNVPGGLVDQIVGTALLVGLVFALPDRRNAAPPPGG